MVKKLHVAILLLVAGYRMLAMEQVNPLLSALTAGNKELARQIILSGKTIVKIDQNGKSALHLAAAKGFDDLVELLLAKAPIFKYSKDAQGRTPLHGAAQTMNGTACARLLVKYGIDIQAQDKFNETALFYACASGNFEMVIFLLAKKAVISPSCIRFAHEGNHLNMLFQLLKGLMRNQVQKTALHCIAENGLTDQARYLLELQLREPKNSVEGFIKSAIPVDVNAIDIYEKTPLHYAMQNGHAELARLLLDHGANPQAQDATLSTPVHLAVNGQNPAEVKKIIDMLLCKGASLLMTDFTGSLPHDCASDSGIREYLAERARQEKMALMQIQAAALKSFEIPLPDLSREAIRQKLLKGSVDILKIYEGGKTLLHRMVADGKWTRDSILKFVALGGNINAQDNLGMTALHYAVINGSDSAYDLLVNTGIGLMIANKAGKTADDLQGMAPRSPDTKKLGAKTMISPKRRSSSRRLFPLAFVGDSVKDLQERDAQRQKIEQPLPMIDELFETVSSGAPQAQVKFT